MTSVGQDLLNVPFPQMVLSLAKAIAEGQFELDKVSCKIAAMMGNKKDAAVNIPNPLKPEEDLETSLIGAGFQPTFYQFTDTTIEVKMSITMTTSSETKVETGAKVGFACWSASVNASYSSKYSYSVEGSSLIRTKITPVPPNAYLQSLLEQRAKLIQDKNAGDKPAE